MRELEQRVALVGCVGLAASFRSASEELAEAAGADCRQKHRVMKHGRTLVLDDLSIGAQRKHCRIVAADLCRKLRALSRRYFDSTPPRQARGSFALHDKCGIALARC